MNKEDLLNKIDTWGVDHIAITGIKDYIKQFFEQNVCISKGINRHKNADIWHEWAENQSINIEHRLNGGEWNDGFAFRQIEVRAKPLEQVYEWQWYRIYNGEVYMNTKGFYTQKEANTWGQQYYKFEETKRLRQ